MSGINNSCPTWQVALCIHDFLFPWVGYGFVPWKRYLEKYKVGSLLIINEGILPHMKNIGQIEPFRQVGVKIKNI